MMKAGKPLKKAVEQENKGGQNGKVTAELLHISKMGSRRMVPSNRMRSNVTFL